MIRADRNGEAVHGVIQPHQIPDAIARIADEAYYDTAGDNPTMSDEDIMKHAIAAALNAWPGMEIEKVFVEEDYLILPLRKENTSD